MLGWSPKDISSLATKTLTANMSAQKVGIEFPLTSGGATVGLLIAIKCASIAGTVTFQLQHGVAGEYTNVTGKTVVASTGWNYIRIHHNVSGDAALLPLLDTAQLVVTTDGSGAGTIEKFYAFQEQ